MGCPCCDGPHSPGAPEQFACQGCGSCCTSLAGRWAGDSSPFQSFFNERIYRRSTADGLRVFAWEADRFPTEHLAPLLVVADEASEQLIALAYVVEVNRCPHYDDAVGCTIYEERPLVCQAYPLLVTQGEAGPELAVSQLCPATVPVLGAASVAERPEPVLSAAYPMEAAAALAVPQLVRELDQLVDFLAEAGAIEPVRGLAEEEVERWRERGLIDLVAFVERCGIDTRETLCARADRTVERVRERWAPVD